MITLGPKQKVVITGAGGWLGTELLELLLAQHGSGCLSESVVCLGTRKRQITLTDGTVIDILPLSENLEIKDVSGFVHLAFLTRDKVADYGTENYSFTNLSITSRAIELIETLQPNWIATVSSGAVLSYPGGPLENSLHRNPYGFTKRVEETMLSDASRRIGAHLSIGRLWGAVGKFMPVNQAYAVSDFIVQAIKTNEINIRSGNKVWRRYCDAAIFMDVLTSSAERFEKSNFDSGGELIEIGDLAVAISELAPYPLVINRSNSDGEEDNYYPDDLKFNSLSINCEIEVGKLKEKIAATYHSHLRELSF